MDEQQQREQFEYEYEQTEAEGKQTLSDEGQALSEMGEATSTSSVDFVAPASPFWACAWGIRG